MELPTRGERSRRSDDAMTASFRTGMKRSWLGGVLALAVVSALASMPPAAPRPAATSVGYVTPKRIFAETNEGKAGVARVQALQQERQTELRTKQQALEAIRQRIAKAADVTERLQLQQQELQQRTEFERSVLQSQNDVLALRHQVEADLQAKVNKLLEELVKGGNVTVVLNQDSSIVWASPSVDFTNAVIERLNARPPEKR
jgi:Skp family chaperone for outer membrane proteins